MVEAASNNGRLRTSFQSIVSMAIILTCAMGCQIADAGPDEVDSGVFRCPTDIQIDGEEGLENDGSFRTGGGSAFLMGVYPEGDWNNQSIQERLTPADGTEDWFNEADNPEGDGVLPPCSGFFPGETEELAETCGTLESRFIVGRGTTAPDGTVLLATDDAFWDIHGAFNMDVSYVHAVNDGASCRTACVQNYSCVDPEGREREPIGTSFFDWVDYLGVVDAGVQRTDVVAQKEKQ